MSTDPEDLLVDPVQISSHQSPDRIRDYLVGKVSEAKIHQESGCVVAEKGPDDGEPHILLNSHMDVVPPDLEVKIEDETIYGRGACDVKASFLQRYMPVAIFDPGLIADEDAPVGHSDREYLKIKNSE
jgi:Acetylornithine deacetylase/Succinyl-diaminopimelate desuccinylase and related deacylases